MGAPVTACILHLEDEHPPEPGWLCCWRARDRMAAALRDIPVLVVELSGLGYVERDVRPLKCTMLICDAPARWRGSFEPKDGPPDPRLALCGMHALILFTDGLLFGVRPVLPVADPIAYALTAGPVNGARNGPRVMSSGERSLPIRIDPTDLLAPARPGSLAVAETGLYASDQIGHLAVATELEFWARDWADALGHHIPLPTVPELACWLLDRLDWACQHHRALDEFAGKLRSLRSSLTAAAGRFDAPTEMLAAPCPGCRNELLYRDTDLECIACGGCPVLLSDEAYAEHARALVAVRLDEESAFPTAER